MASGNPFSVEPIGGHYAWILIVLSMLAGLLFANAAVAEETKPTLQVGAYYYPWYDNSQFGRERHWGEGYIETPSLGRYSCLDPTVLEHHIEWAKEAGINFFVTSWWGPKDFTDTTLQYQYLRHPKATQVPIALFYEVRSRFKDSRIDFNNPANRATLVRDFEYLAQTYFSHPAYLKLAGKPVVFIYLTRVFTGDYTAALKEVRAAVSKLGYDMYLVADEVYHGRPVLDRAGLFDAVTAYNMHSSNMAEDDWQAFLTRTDTAYRTWQTALTGLNSPVLFPNAMPGFNDWGVRPQEKHPRFFPSPERFRLSLQLALKYVDPRMPVLLITSFNEWHEDTQIEPSMKYGESYLLTLNDELHNVRK